MAADGGAESMLAEEIVTIGEIVVEVVATEPGQGFLQSLFPVGSFRSGAPAIIIDQVGASASPAA